MSPENACEVIKTCVTLHNLALKPGDEDHIEEPIENDFQEEQLVDAEILNANRRQRLIQCF